MNRVIFALLITTFILQKSQNVIKETSNINECCTISWSEPLEYEKSKVLINFITCLIPLNQQLNFVQNNFIKHLN